MKFQASSHGQQNNHYTKLKWNIVAGIAEVVIFWGLSVWSACQTSLWREGRDFSKNLTEIIRYGFALSLLHGTIVARIIAKGKEYLKDISSIFVASFGLGLLIWCALSIIGSIWLIPKIGEPLAWEEQFGAKNAKIIQSFDSIVGAGQPATIEKEAGSSIKGYRVMDGDGVFEITRVENVENVQEPELTIPMGVPASGRKKAPFWGDHIVYKVGGAGSEDRLKFKIQGEVKFDWKVVGPVRVTGHLEMPVVYPARASDPYNYFKSGFSNHSETTRSGEVRVLIVPVDQYQSVIARCDAVKSVLSKAEQKAGWLCYQGSVLVVFWIIIGISVKDEHL